MSTATFVSYEPEQNQLQLSGQWVFSNYLAIQRALQQLPQSVSVQQLDCSQLQRLDLNTAALLTGRLNRTQLRSLIDQAQGLKPVHHAVFEQLLNALTVAENEPAPAPQPWYHWVSDLGRWVDQQLQQFLLLCHFIGLVLVTAGRVLLNPRRWRLTSCVAHMQQSGLAAIPIIALMAFLVGAVLAFLGATVLVEFGATLYTVDLVAFGFMRELGVLLTAILLAGRTASSFTAQIGAMKVNEELDAMQVEQLNPIEMLVLPRLFALLIMMPLLTFIATTAGLVGGAAVAVLSLDISLTHYLSMLNEVPIRHFWVGISKAPFFALIIGIIGCLEGFKVSSNARSIGVHTTKSVVQALFAVILLDAIAALFFMEMGW